MEAVSQRGKLLVATPALDDPNFFRTVVLIVEHSADGAAGVVLNRPSGSQLEGPLVEWASAAAEPAVVFVGGPVQQDAAVCLGAAAPGGEPPGFKPFLGRLGTLDLTLGPDDVVPHIDRLRVFAGYAGWGGGQLEDEIDEGAWFVLDADPEDALSASPDRLWRFVLRRQGGDLALVSNFPDDPSLN